jgi:H+-transporting ATPase
MTDSTHKTQKISAADALKECKSQMKGLTNELAENRLQEYGYNAMEEKKESLFKKLLVFFWGPIPWMIEIAALLSAFLSRWDDLTVILLMLFINAALGFFQEYKAGNAIEALKKKLALKAQVLRDGKWIEIDAKNVAFGDIISVQIGNIVPADIYLLDGEYLSIDQSALTGESLPVNKEKGDEAYSGSIVKAGKMIGVVKATGMNTFFGKTAKLVSQAQNRSHLQQAVLKIGNFLIFSTLGVCFVILLISLYRLEISHTDHETIGQMVIFLLVLVIAGIPVALPAVLSATLAIGANQLAKMKAIVSRLTSIEELASMDILCSDKTGTLTKNVLTVGDVELFETTNKDDVFETAFLASDSHNQDAIDEAITKCITNKDKLKDYKTEKFTPFDPVSKFAQAIIKTPDGKTITMMKGAPQVVLTITKPSKEIADKILQGIETFAQKGYRTLGIARQENNTWKYLGLIPLFDPARDDTKETIDHLHDMGVEVKMVTGDHASIAKELSAKLDIGDNIVSVKELYDKNTPSRNRDKLIAEANGFAEVYPEHKFEIIQTLQNQNHVVGMTGDGVNDAPALKQADIGIAVSGATDAAKEAADVVLTEPGLLVISKAIEEARKIFGRMKSYSMYRISETIRLILFLFLSMIVFNDHPLTAIMIILIALLNDIPIMMIAYDNMRVHTKPVSWNMNEILTISIGLAIIGVISTFGLYWIGDQFWFAYDADPVLKFHKLRTLAFMAILCGGNLTIYLTRNIRSVFQRPLPEWKFFLSTLFSQIIGTFISAYGLGTDSFVGIGWKYVGFAWIYILIWFVICMFTKEALYRIIGYRKTYFDSFVDKTGKKIHPHPLKG